MVTVKKHLYDVNERRRKNEEKKQRKRSHDKKKPGHINGTCIKLVSPLPMLYSVVRISFECVCVCKYLCRFFHPIHVWQSFCSSIYVHSHFVLFSTLHSYCNKFSGETLNINLLFCWLRLFYYPVLSFIWLVNSSGWGDSISNGSRHGCWQCMSDSITIGERTCTKRKRDREKEERKKNEHHISVWTRKWFAIYQNVLALATCTFWIQHANKKKRNSMQDNVPFDTYNLWRLVFHFISSD